jgi:hypothetical protein
LKQTVKAMSSTLIRKKLITYLADADDKKVKAVYALLEDEIEDKAEFIATKEQLRLIEERRKRHKEGKDDSVTWKTAHEKIRNGKK